MKVIRARNVNDAYVKGRELLEKCGERRPSRAGEVLVCPFPVTTVYEQPTERVLFDSARDANPFFHLFEALWMLDGGLDARWLDRFVSDFSVRYAESNGMMHGAYGHRWRRAFGFDQLNAVVEKLKYNPDDRQAVIQMWDCKDSNDLNGAWKDRPCNTHVYLRVRTPVVYPGALTYGNAGLVAVAQTPTLDMTVCCRSNDVIWGAYGANAVHFSVLQEYLAARIGVNVGKYYQISNNFHGYAAELEKRAIPAWEEPSWKNNKYEGATFGPTALVTHPKDFDQDLFHFINWTLIAQDVEEVRFKNPWFRSTAVPLYEIAVAWRAGDRKRAIGMLECNERISPDWRFAAWEWMKRRVDKAKQQEATGV